MQHNLRNKLTARKQATDLRVGAWRRIESLISGSTHVRQREPCCWKSPPGTQMLVLANPAIEASEFDQARTRMAAEPAVDAARVLVAKATNNTAIDKWFPLGMKAKRFSEGDLGAFCRKDDPRVVAVGHDAPFHDFDVVPCSKESSCFQLIPYEQLSEGNAVNIAEEAEGGATWPWRNRGRLATRRFRIVSQTFNMSRNPTSPSPNNG